MLNKLVVILLFTFSALSPCVEAYQSWNRVFLASYPRSGNHWARYLIEEASQITTSSVYCDWDPQHQPTPFPWGGYSIVGGYTGTARFPTLAEMVVIKTHYPAHSLQGFDALPYVKTIRIVRDPIDSFYSFYVYVNGEQSPHFKLPRANIDQYIKSWRLFQEYWNQQGSVLTIRYEDLYKDPYRYLKQIMETLGYAVTDADILRAIAKYPPRGGLQNRLKHYSKHDLKEIKDKLKDLLKQFHYHIHE